MYYYSSTIKKQKKTTKQKQQQQSTHEQLKLYVVTILHRKLSDVQYLSKNFSVFYQEYQTPSSRSDQIKSIDLKGYLEMRKWG